MMRHTASMAAMAGFLSFVLLLAIMGPSRRDTALLEQQATTSGPRMMDVGGGQQGYGPYYYWDTNTYPLNTNYVVTDGQDKRKDVQRLPPPSKEYMRGYAKDFNSYFDGGADELPNPIQAGYWPYQTRDGLIASGEAGNAGNAIRSWSAMNSQGTESPLAKVNAQGKEDLSMDEYLDMEAIYRKDLRFYTEDDWP